MDKARAVQAYYDSIAPSYQPASERFLWSIVRNREVAALFAMLGNVSGRDVLELGCGAGFYTRLLLDRGARHVFAVDISQKMLAELPQEKVTPVLGDAAVVDPGRTFDVMLSAGMLEFVTDPVAVFKNAVRYAAPGAKLVVLYPSTGVLARGYQWFHRRHGLAVSVFSSSAIGAAAEQAGWRVEATAKAGPYSACAKLIGPR
jgi:ubiquinone/menaquinone biosynthesis C-methylase UbiE